MKPLLDDYKPVIIDNIDTYAATAMAVYKFIEKKVCKGKHSTVATFVKTHKNYEVSKATIRFGTSPGFQSQVD